MNKNHEQKWIQYQQSHGGQGHSAFSPFKWISWHFHWDAMRGQYYWLYRTCFVSKNRDLFSLSPFGDKKGFIFSLHRVRKGVWATLEYSEAKIGLTYFAVWMNTQVVSNLVLAFKTASLEKNRESYRNTKLCIGRATEERKGKCQSLMQKKFRSLWSSALHAYRNHSSYNCS